VRRAAAFRAWLTERYLTIDARSVGLGRIAVATVLLIDLIRRVPVLRLFYSNEGLIPNHTLLWRPPTPWMFSFFFLASLPDEAMVGFAICALVYLALLVGYRTRLMRFLAVVCVLSVHGRATFIENGGDWMLSELTVWSAFLPLGRRFSVDALLAGLRRRHDTSAADLRGRAAMLPPDRGPPVVSLAAFTILFQLAVAYFFNAVQKGGPTWRHGSAVHYVLYQNRMVTSFAVWMRSHMTLGLSRVLSYAALATEGTLPVLILSPWGRPWTRRAAVLAIVGLHLGFQLFINLGVFSWTMIAYAPFLLAEADWSLFERWAGRSRRPGLRVLANRAYDAFARRRTSISTWLGLAACGVPTAGWGASSSPVGRADLPPAPIRLAVRYAVAVLREGAVLAMLIVLVAEALMINPVVPKFLKPEEPGWIKRLVAYPRLIQAWSMFAADAPTDDESVVVDAVTEDGRHVDPYSEVSSRYAHPGTERIPTRLDNDSFFFNYSVRIPDQIAYHQAFLEWILRYPDRTGRPEDRIVKFDAYRLSNDSPPPGETEPRNFRKRVFLSYP
jgi:vitamin K-dependent gamma-carboxylase-like protein